MDLKLASVFSSVLASALFLASCSKLPALAPKPLTEAEIVAKKTQANAEILQEMIRVVLLKEPSDRSTFSGFVDTMNQGLSIEGLYNGFTLSSEYRDLETRSPVASGEAVKIFVEELVQLELELPQPTVFDERSALPIPRPVQPGEVEPAPIGGPENGNGGFARDLSFPGAKASVVPVSGTTAVATATPAGQPLTREGGMAIFGRASILTLKRVLGSEGLKVIRAKKATPDGLSLWYGKFAARLATRGVDFGIALRNKADEAFHVQWAKSATEDQLVWEVLNRLHRLLNAANTKK